jgi:hypothetical protein
MDLLPGVPVGEPTSLGQSTLTGLNTLRQGADVPVAQCVVPVGCNSLTMPPVVWLPTSQPPACMQGELIAPVCLE